MTRGLGFLLSGDSLPRAPDATEGEGKETDDGHAYSRR